MTANVKPMLIGVNGFPVTVLLIDTNDTQATVTTAGYLSANASTTIPFSDKQTAFVYTTDAGVGNYQVSVDSLGIASLIADSATGVVSIFDAPVTDKNFAVFYGTSGQQIQDLSYSPTNASDTKVVMAAGTFVAGNLVQAGDTAGSIAPGPVAANTVLTSSIVTPDVGINLVRFDATISTTTLASAGTATLFASSGSKQYKIVGLWLNFGSNLAVGNRNLTLSDGTTTYSIIPSASLLTLVNATWGSTALPFPTAAALNTSTAAGANLLAQYSGGTTDYTTGANITISGILQRVA